MTAANSFQRAYSRHHKQQRAADLVAAARTLGTRDGVRAVTLTAIATQAGVHASAVRRYYASREEILLTLTEEGYRDWAHDIATRLAGRQDVTSGELARILTASLAERPLFCDLLTHVTLSLEREVSFERVHAFKSVAITAVGTLVDAITAASTLNQDQASDLIIGVIAMTAPLWQAGHPAETLTRLYAEEPAMAHIGIDFEPTLTRLITALIDGMTHPEHRSAQDPPRPLGQSSDAGNDQAVSTRSGVQFPERDWQAGRVTISERIAAARRERRVLARVSRAAWRLDQAERERTWALVSARAEGISIRTLAAAIGLSPSRVHQVVAGADLNAVNAVLGELRIAGWPAPEDPDSDEDADLDGRDHLADRLSDEVDWLRQCAGWLRQLDGGGYPPTVNLRPSADWPDRAVVTLDLARVQAVIDRIAADVDELARAWRAGDLDTAAVLPDRRAERRRRLAEPDLEFRAFCAREGLPASSTLQLERAWDAWQAERYRRGEIGQRPGYTDNPFRPR